MVVVVILYSSLYMYITKAATDEGFEASLYCSDIALTINSMFLEKGNITLIYNLGSYYDLSIGEGIVSLKYEKGSKEIVEKCYYINNEFCNIELEKRGVLFIIKKVC